MGKIYLQTKINGSTGQVLGFDSNHHAIAQNFSGGFSPKIFVEGNSGLTVKATKDSIVVNATYVNNHYEMVITDFGTWTVTKGSESTTVDVIEAIEYTVSFASKTLNDNN